MKINKISFQDLQDHLKNRHFWALLFLGFSAGIPILLIFSSLSIWLKQAGMARADITFFSWAALGYGFKYIWAPLVDRLPFPVLSRLLGQRRGWLLITQMAVMVALIGMALSNPQNGALSLALFAVLLGFSSATQDIVIDAYRIEIAPTHMQGLLAGSYVAGYRVAMILASAGLLELVGLLSPRDPIDNEIIYSYGAWQTGYFLMAAVMLVGIATTLWIKEPKAQADNRHTHSDQDYLRFFISFVLALLLFIGVFYLLGQNLPTFPEAEGYIARLITILREFIRLSLSALIGFMIFRMLANIGFAPSKLIDEGYKQPFIEFFKRIGLAGAVLIIIAIGFYRAPDIIMGTTANILYVDLGYDVSEIGRISKGYGLFMVIFGGLLAGYLITIFGVNLILYTGLFLAAATNILFSWLAQSDATILGLILVISADNLSSGAASVAFVAWLSRLTNIHFTASQYALFSSLAVLGPKFIGGYSGGMVDAMGYSSFYIMTAFVGIPALILIWLACRFEAKSKKKE